VTYIASTRRAASASNSIIAIPPLGQ